MKVIDLLNKMANNEEVPKKVKINNEPFEYDEIIKMYYTLEKDEYFGLFPLLFYDLNDEGLDNILQMCINAVSMPETQGTRTLYNLGIHTSDYPRTRIQALPHYQDFLDAGWIIGD